MNQRFTVFVDHVAEKSVGSRIGDATHFPPRNTIFVFPWIRQLVLYNI